MRFLRMQVRPYLSDAEFTSLAEIGTGLFHAEIPADHAEHLLELGLTYNFLGSVRITTTGRRLLRVSHREHWTRYRT